MKKLILGAIIGLASFAVFAQEGYSSTETSFTASCGTAYCATTIKANGLEKTQS